MLGYQWRMQPFGGCELDVACRHEFGIQKVIYVRRKGMQSAKTGTLLQNTCRYCIVHDHNTVSFRCVFGKGFSFTCC